jgi:hypothetical protein
MIVTGSYTDVAPILLITPLVETALVADTTFILNIPATTQDSLFPVFR